MQQLIQTPGGAARFLNEGATECQSLASFTKPPLFPSINTPGSFFLFFFPHILLFNQTGSTQIPRLRQQHLKINWHGGVFPWQPASSLPVYTCIITIRLQHQDCRDERRRRAFSYRDVFSDITEPQRLHRARHMEGKNAMGRNNSQSRAI